MNTNNETYENRGDSFLTLTRTVTVQGTTVTATAMVIRDVMSGYTTVMIEAKPVFKNGDENLGLITDVYWDRRLVRNDNLDELADEVMETATEWATKKAENLAELRNSTGYWRTF